MIQPLSLSLVNWDVRQYAGVERLCLSLLHLLVVVQNQWFAALSVIFPVLLGTWDSEWQFGSHTLALILLLQICLVSKFALARCWLPGHIILAWNIRDSVEVKILIAKAILCWAAIFGALASQVEVSSDSNWNQTSCHTNACNQQPHKQELNKAFTMGLHVVISYHKLGLGLFIFVSFLIF